MGLDINTEEGQKTLEDERRTIDIFRYNFPNLKYIETDKETSARCDGLIIKDNHAIAIVEQKSRDMSLELFQTEYRERWLITAEKVDRLIDIANAMHVSLFGFLYLKRDDLLLAKTIFNIKTGELVKIERFETETQATCNGGTARRLNAFIDMSGAKQYRAPHPKNFICRVCGAMAHYGFNVNYRADKGEWYCLEHKPHRS